MNQLPVPLPRIQPDGYREALGLLGFRGTQTSNERFTFAHLPAGWREHRSKDSDIVTYRDRHGRDRVIVDMKATFCKQGTSLDGDPILVDMPSIEILRRFKVSDDGDPHYRVFDRVRGINLAESFDSRELAMAYLDERYPGWNGNVLKHWDDVDLTA
jgi:hypothetical protein